MVNQIVNDLDIDNSLNTSYQFSQDFKIDLVNVLVG